MSERVDLQSIGRRMRESTLKAWESDLAGKMVTIPAGYSVMPGCAIVSFGRITDRDKFLSEENNRFQRFINR